MSLNLTQKIAYNAASSTIARIIDTAITLFIVAIVTRYLGPDGFGDYITVVTFVYIFSVIADLGLYSIVVREISRKGADEENIVNNAFTLRVTAGFFILGSAYFISLLFPYSEETRYGIIVAAIGFWILSNSQVLIGLFQKHLAMDKVAFSEVIGRTIQLVFVLVFVFYGFGFLYIILAVFLGAVFNFFFILYFASRYIKVRLKFNFILWKKILKQSSSLAVSAILVLIYFKLDTIFLSVMKTSKDVGVYGISYKIMENLIFFPSMIVGLAMPIMSKHIFSNKPKFESVAQKTLNLLIVILVPVAIGTAAVSHKIIKLIAGSGFDDSPSVLNILMIALCFIFLGALFSNIIIAANKQKHLAQIYFVGMIFNIAANIIFIPQYSYFGAAATTAATEILVTILMVFVIRKTVGYTPSFTIFYKAAASSLMMASVLYYFTYLNIFYLISIGTAIYITAIYLLGGISQEDIKKLLK